MALRTRLTNECRCGNSSSGQPGLGSCGLRSSDIAPHHLYASHDHNTCAVTS
ncbi:hypothetical protein BU23DRAFT_94212 [Bimuria novae-zelandiae CBS 107.79]|uniref:Uncharacterized protein n=1 Tax=Bimuria novae-zelandiae CBS 107.79 TaxID=1447943 RepID=A0A6A5VBF4_9PLEO|nr:hypothetical protein BU23DRAFT_94212 [Bimuria novae-zelandiae CBS 107.79]